MFSHLCEEVFQIEVDPFFYIIHSRLIYWFGEIVIVIHLILDQPIQCQPAPLDLEDIPLPVKMNSVLTDMLLHQVEFLMHDYQEIDIVPVPILPYNREPGDQILDTLSDIVPSYSHDTPLEPEEGNDPPTFRLQGGCSAN